MPALPAFKFLGQTGINAWIAAVGAGAGGIIVATKVLPAVTGGGSSSGSGGGSSSSDKAVSAIGALAATLARSQGAVVQSALGPGAQLGAGGLGLAGSVTRVLGDVTMRQTSALEDVTRASVQATAQQSLGILAFLDKVAQRITTPAPVTPPAPSPPPATPATITPAPTPAAAPSTPAPVVERQPPSRQVTLGPDLPRGTTLLEAASGGKGAVVSEPIGPGGSMVRETLPTASDAAFLRQYGYTGPVSP